MDTKQLSTLFAWAEDGTRTLYFAFGIGGDDDEGVLCLHRYHKGKSILHDLASIQDDLDLKTRRFGTVAVDAKASTVTFNTNRTFGSREQKALKLLLRKTSVKGYEIEYAKAVSEDDDQA